MPENRKIEISGTVQGVGFRPFVWRCAVKNNITGFVGNSPQGVFIEARGEKEELEKFINDIKNNKPPSATINTFVVKKLPNKSFQDFKIVKSENIGKAFASVPPDLAICESCIADIEDASNRRFEYPFTNCTNCGPRFTIIKKIPYDRPYTTMKKFKMCKECLSEYENPEDRRFHAQPNACHSCGPEVFLTVKGKIVAENALAIDRLVEIILRGGLVAIKGLGGFHLSCDAENEAAVKKLREFKSRHRKPFAVMTDSIKGLEKYLFISKEEKDIMFSSKAPIVTFKKKKNYFFHLAAPDLSSIGIMIPYTPLHRIIFKKLRQKGFKGLLIMTSGNLRDEPITKDNESAISLFANFDAILLHNRDIHNRIDDSLVSVDDSGRERVFRRARGYVPNSFVLALKSRKDIFAAGADIKNSFAFTRGRELFLSQYIGDLDDSANADFFRETYKKMKDMLLIEPKEAVADLHPDYRSVALARETDLNLYRVQHHISHFFSVMAEHRLNEAAVGIILDGTGYGLDGKIWGGEFFVYKDKKIFRKAKLANFRLPGGEICVHAPFRTLLGLLHSYGIKDYEYVQGPAKDIDIVNRMLNKNFNCVETSSMGRLFDAFSALILDKPFAGYEAELPMELESVFLKESIKGYTFYYKEKYGDIEIFSDRAIVEVLRDKKLKKSIPLMSSKFHLGLADICAKVALKISKDYGIKTFCLSGGCFQNSIFTKLLRKSLQLSQCKVYTNDLIPTNDGGIAAGQIYFRLLNPKILDSKID